MDFIKSLVSLLEIKSAWKNDPVDPLKHTYTDDTGTVSITHSDSRHSNDVLITDLESRVERKGNGTKLVKKALAYAKKLGHKQVSVFPEPTLAAKRFWKTKFNIPPKGGILKT